MPNKSKLPPLRPRLQSAPRPPSWASAAAAATATAAEAAATAAAPRRRRRRWRRARRRRRRRRRGGDGGGDGGGAGISHTSTPTRTYSSGSCPNNCPGRPVCESAYSCHRSSPWLVFVALWQVGLVKLLPLPRSSVKPWQFGVSGTPRSTGRVCQARRVNTRAPSASVSATPAVDRVVPNRILERRTCVFPGLCGGGRRRLVRRRSPQIVGIV